jgi:hypothetical protein
MEGPSSSAISSMIILHVSCMQIYLLFNINTRYEFIAAYSMHQQDSHTLFYKFVHSFITFPLAYTITPTQGHYSPVSFTSFHTLSSHNLDLKLLLSGAFNQWSSHISFISSSVFYANNNKRKTKQQENVTRIQTRKTKLHQPQHVQK